MDENLAGNAPQVIGSTDWLGSEPVFFESRSGSVSASLSSLTPAQISPEDFDEEGLANFLDFGYSVFGKTPLNGVQFLEANMSLLRKPDGSILQERRPDPFFEKRTMWSEGDVIEMVRASVREWEAALPPDQEIVLPLSGGLDSRLLLWSIENKDRIRAFTYGTSPDQARSFEVVYARELSEKFAIRWEHIQLGHYHKHLGVWNKEFGLSTHAHGMYQIEFYEKILARLERPQTILSGIVGDLWAGSMPFLEIRGVEDLHRLGHSHGLHADSSKLHRQPAQKSLMEHFWQKNAEGLRDPRFQTLTVVRLKMMLLSYLLKVPRSMGFEVWSPFLEPEIALAMLDIKSSRRSNRVWQKDFFAKEGLLPRLPVGAVSRRNNLNAQALQKVSLLPLSLTNLEGVIAGDYVRWINTFIRDGWAARTQNTLQAASGRVLRRIGTGKRIHSPYAAYLCLYPLDVAMGPNREDS